MNETEIMLVRDAYLSAGDAEGNSKEALWCADHDDRAKCLERLALEGINRIFIEHGMKPLRL